MMLAEFLLFLHKDSGSYFCWFVIEELQGIKDV